MRKYEIRSRYCIFRTKKNYYVINKKKFHFPTIFSIILFDETVRKKPTFSQKNFFFKENFKNFLSYFNTKLYINFEAFWYRNKRFFFAVGSNDRTAHKEKTCHKCTEQNLYMHAPRRHLNEWTKKFFWRSQIWLGCFVLHRYRLETECARCRRSGVGCINFMYIKNGHRCVLYVYVIHKVFSFKYFFVIAMVIYTNVESTHTVTNKYMYKIVLRIYIKVLYSRVFFFYSSIILYADAY